MILWRRPVNFGNEKHTHFMLRRMYDTSTTQLDNRAVKCSVCPCDWKWYIVTFCTCDNCDGVIDKMQAGDIPVICGGGDQTNVVWPLGAEHSPYPILKALDITGGFNSSQGGLGEEGFAQAFWLYDPLWAIKNSYLSSIRHELSSAPFDAIVTAKLFIDGAEHAGLEGLPQVVAKGESGWLGSMQGEKYGDGYCENNIGIVGTGGSPPQFTQGRPYVVTIEVTYTATNSDVVPVGTTASYMAARTVLVWDFGAAPTVGGVYVVPFPPRGPDGFTCEIIGAGGLTLYPNYIAGHQFGPYNNRDEAIYVVDHWDEFLGALGGTCSCPLNCLFRKTFGMNYWYYNEQGGYWTGESYGGVDDPASQFMCGTAWVTLEVGTSGGGIVIVTRPDGTEYSIVSPNGGRYNIPPCHWVSIRYYGNEDPNELDPVPYVAGDMWQTSALTWCVLEDEESPFYGRTVEYTKGPDGIEGIPANSEELADYLGDKRACELTEGHHWDQGPPAKCVEDTP